MLLGARLLVFLCLPFILSAVLSAQSITVSQPTVWASKPDVAAFEKMENDRLAEFAQKTTAGFRSTLESLNGAMIGAMA